MVAENNLGSGSAKARAAASREKNLDGWNRMSQTEARFSSCSDMLRVDMFRI